MMNKEKHTHTEMPLPQAAPLVLDSEASVAEKALLILESKLGMHEVGGPNMGPIVDWAVARFTHTHPDKTGWAQWCAGAVCTAFAEAGSTLILQVGSLWVPSLYRNLHKRGLAVRVQKNVIPSSFTPQAGDIVFFGRQTPKHVEIVKAYDRATHRIQSVGGNVDDAVRERVSGSFFGFARIGQ